MMDIGMSTQGILQSGNSGVFLPPGSPVGPNSPAPTPNPIAMEDSGEGSGEGGGNNGGGEGGTGGGGEGGGGGSTSTESTGTSSTPPSTTPAWQQPVDSRNSAALASTNTRATNPQLPPGSEVNFNNIEANSGEFMTSSSLAGLEATETSKAEAGQAEATKQGEVAQYDATLIAKKQADEAMMSAATSAIASSHLVSGRLTELLKPGPDGEWPTWAKGAATKAQQLMAARGIDNSSMAGQAIMAAIIDNALPIAQGDSQALVAMDMQNLSNRQQAELFNAQQKGQFLLSNQAADNAAKNFNASSINQSNEFFANLATQVSTFNAAQRTAISKSNADAENAMKQFDKTLQDSRDKFNTQNDLVVQQANTTWRRNINTTNTAAQNEANRINALNKLGISNTAYNNMWQQYRDESTWAFTGSENKEDRQNKLAQIALYQQGKMQLFNEQQAAAFQQAFGSFLAGMFDGALNAL